MPTGKILLLVAVFFLTSVISVVTGGTSLITVPVMIALGIEAHVAVAAHARVGRQALRVLGDPRLHDPGAEGVALQPHAVGVAEGVERRLFLEVHLPVVGRGVLSRSRLRPSIVLTIIGSGLGAFLLLSIPLRALQVTIAVAMIGVAVFSLLSKNLGRANHDAPASHVGVITGYVVTFLLAIYGGLFSGGYVTMLTAAFVLLFGMTFLQAVATTKVINVFSSGVATVVFIWRGVVDLKLGIILGVFMFLGALLGSRIALFLGTVWLRRIFIAAVLALAVKLLLPLH